MTTPRLTTNPDPTPAAARDALDALCSTLDPDGTINCAARELLIALDDYFDTDTDCNADTRSLLIALIDRIADDRETLTATLLDFSLCPMHMIDYAICFDDDDDECAAIRSIHPSHDT